LRCRHNVSCQGSEGSIPSTPTNFPLAFFAAFAYHEMLYVARNSISFRVAGQSIGRTEYVRDGVGVTEMR
jgi:hypothetical protein